MKYLNPDNIQKSTNEIEYHPLIPFLPKNGRVLFLGSFPPQRKRWCQNFYYPNFSNDHWRIEGLIFYGDRNHFVDIKNKTFRLDSIISFLEEKGIGFFDAATSIKRLKDNASDKFLEIIERTDIISLLDQMPQCNIIATTGEKSAKTICEIMDIPDIPSVGKYVKIPKTSRLTRDIVLYRLPSSSRAYPLSLEKKAKFYADMFRYAELLP